MSDSQQPPIDSDDSNPTPESDQNDSTAGQDDELARLRIESSDWKDRCLRAHAEMEMMRRRHEKDRLDTVKFSNESILKDIIPVLDSFEQAAPEVQGESPDELGTSFMAGFVMVKRQLLTVLAKHGLEPVISVGEPFDPNVHQAIQRTESADVNDEVVQMEFAKGYTLHGRLVRPAMVAVKVPGTKSPN